MHRPRHQKLIVYRRALDSVVLLDGVVKAIPGVRADWRDQLRRASISIPLNVAEGAGEFSRAEKDRFYRIARRSTAECLAVLDILDLLEPEVATTAPRAVLIEVSGMLTAMVMRSKEKG